MDIRMRATFTGVSGTGSGMGCVRGRPRGLLDSSLLLLGMGFCSFVYKELYHDLGRTLKGACASVRQLSDITDSGISVSQNDNQAGSEISGTVVRSRSNDPFLENPRHLRQPR